MAASLLFLALSILLLSSPSQAFYLPGVAPQDFRQGDRLLVKVNGLTSTKTQLPYGHYSLPLCKPKQIVNSAENLGEVLRGDRIENSPYMFKMKEDKLCRVVCRIEKLSAKDAEKFVKRIGDDYRVNMILDNLPLAVNRQRIEGGTAVTNYELGYPVGFHDTKPGSSDKIYFIHNHLAFTVLYHKDPDSESSRIVGFEVVPFRYFYEHKKRMVFTLKVLIIATIITARVLSEFVPNLVK